jgi:hypothetical protein
MLPSSVFVSCAASRIVKGRTRTQTEMLLELEEAIGVCKWQRKGCRGGRTKDYVFALCPGERMSVCNSSLARVDLSMLFDIDSSFVYNQPKQRDI